MTRFGLDPVQAGLLGRLSYHLVGTGSASAADPGVFSSNSRADTVGLFSTLVATFGATSGDADTGNPPEVTLNPGDCSDTRDLMAGANVEIRLISNSSAGRGFFTIPEGSSASSVNTSLDYTVQLFEDRATGRPPPRHRWGRPSPGSSRRNPTP